MLIEYYFKIKHIKGIDNAKADTLNRKVELQGSEKLLIQYYKWIKTEISSTIN